MLPALAWLLLAGLVFLILQWSIRLWKEQQFRFSDKTVLITGGSRGLGTCPGKKAGAEGSTHRDLCS